MVQGEQNLHEFTVAELAQALKRHVEGGFPHVRVRGEISGFKRAASGHMYLGLKEDKAVIDGVCWRGVAAKLGFEPEDGLEVICTGKLTTYPDRSKYQIVITSMEPAGAGAMMAMLEERKKKLEAEGLFDADRKQAIPYLPRTIGVVTSPTGAVIRDILHRLADRFPRHVLVWPVIVQGEGAAQQIADGIRGFNALEKGGTISRPDVLIVARGGGSIEDLWAFNEEVVVRAAAASEIPLISAVGHETDTTLIDYVADWRAPTPSAAAEKAVPVRADLAATLGDLNRRIRGARVRLHDQLGEHLAGLARGLPKPRDILGLVGQRLDEMCERLPRGLMGVTANNQMRLARISAGLTPAALKAMIAIKQQIVSDNAGRLGRATSGIHNEYGARFDATARVLDTLSYQKVLERGFAVVFDGAGHAITTRSDVSGGMALEVQLKDGRFDVVAGEAAVSALGAKKPRRKKARAVDDKQGTLL
jgi:exodeoxyribonuclease VII large subunit